MWDTPRKINMLGLCVGSINNNTTTPIILTLIRWVYQSTSIDNSMGPNIPLPLLLLVLVLVGWFGRGGCVESLDLKGPHVWRHNIPLTSKDRQLSGKPSPLPLDAAVVVVHVQRAKGTHLECCAAFRIQNQWWRRQHAARISRSPATLLQTSDIETTPPAAEERKG